MICSNCRKIVSPVGDENPHIVDPNAQRIEFFCTPLVLPRCPHCGGVIGNCNPACHDQLSDAKRLAHKCADDLIEVERECWELFIAGNQEAYNAAYSRREDIARELRRAAWDAGSILAKYQFQTSGAGG